MRLLIVGNDGGTNIGGSFLRAAVRLGWKAELLPARRAMEAPWLVRQWSWRVLGRRPPRLADFSRLVGDAVRRVVPDVLLATGIAPIAAHVVREANELGVTTVVFLTDDPLGAAHKAPWFLPALRHYRVAGSPRRANLRELQEAGCRHVSYVPFGYDPELHYPVPPSAELGSDVLFVGGYEPERAAFLRRLKARGINVAVYGDWRWRVHGRLRGAYCGHAPTDELRTATCSARVNVVLGRRGNRDGHTMRTFEVLACGGTPLVENTSEHRELLAEVLPPESLFSDPDELVERARHLLSHPGQCSGIAARGREWATEGGHRYDDRLLQLTRAATAASGI